MTSFNAPSLNGQYGSELLQKHLQRSAANNQLPQKTNISTSNLSQKDDSFEKKDKSKSKKAKIAATSLGAAIIMSAISILGGTKVGRKTAGKISSTISNGISKYLKKLYENNRSEKLDNFIRKFYSIKGSAGKYSNSVENIVNGKDVLTTAITDSLSARKIKTNNMPPFKKAAVDLYKKTIGKFFGLYENFKAATSSLYFRKGIIKNDQRYIKAGKAKGKFNEEVLRHLGEIKKSSRANETILYKGKKVKILDVISDLEKEMRQNQKRFDKHFDTDAVKLRLGSFYNGLLGNTKKKGLEEMTAEEFAKRIKDKKFKELLTDPVARKIIEKDKGDYIRRTSAYKDEVSSALENIFKIQRDNIVDLAKQMGTDDLDSFYHFEDVIKTFDKYKNQVFDGSEASIKAKDAVLEKLDELSAAIHAYSKKTNNAGAKDVLDSVNAVKNSILNARTNDTDELMGALRQILDPNVYEKTILPKYKKSRKLFNKAFTMETNDMLDKFRDIVCGSAPTDFMTVITSAGLLGLYTAQAENNDERVSIGLTTGLPILSTVGMNLYGAINAISGKSSMGLSLAVGAVTKTICDSLNKGYRKLRGLDENEKPSVKTIDDYIEPHKNKFENVFNKKA